MPCTAVLSLLSEVIFNNALRELSTLSLKTVVETLWCQDMYVFFFSFVSAWTKETNRSPLLVLKDTQYSVTSIIKLLQRQTLRAAGNNCLGKCFEFFMKHTWYRASDGVRVTVFCSCRDTLQEMPHWKKYCITYFYLF